MAKGNNQKPKLLYLVKIFREKTDEQHGLTLAQIAQTLESYGISADRKTLYADFDELRDFGFDIISRKKGKTVYYFLGSREFQLPELKLLVDSVQSAKFITETKSRQLIKKLGTLTSAYEAGKLSRQVILSGRVKTMNESIYYNVDKIHTAIGENRRIKFKYFQWNLKKEMEPRRNGEYYIADPWHLVRDDESYYLIAFEPGGSAARHYRVDKMKFIELTDQPRDPHQGLSPTELARYSTRLFGMFGGESVRVTLQVKNDMIPVILDRFGTSVQFTETGPETQRVTVNVIVSDHFLGWIISLGENVKVIGPGSVVEQMKGIARRMQGQYLK